jgi:hypothetical protein
MSSHKFAVTVTALAAVVTFSACSRKHSTPQASAPTDSAVAAEQELNKSGCSFQSGPEQSTTGGESTPELDCKPSKDTSGQLKALTDYTSKVSASMKEKGRQNIGQLQSKLNLATSKLIEMQAEAKPTTETKSAAE